MANHLIAKFYKENLLNLYCIVKVYLAFNFFDLITILMCVCENWPPLISYIKSSNY